jgi:hypothetical protein
MSECQAPSVTAENAPAQKQRKTWPDSKLRPRRPAIAQVARRREVQEELLAAYERLGSIMGAAEEVGIARSDHYEWLEHDEAYAAMWIEAQEASTQVLEREAVTRATVGQDKGVYYQGEKVGVEQYKSDVLLIFMLKSRRPDVYRDRYEVSGPQGGPIHVAAMRPDALSRLSEAQLDALLALNGPVAALTGGKSGAMADIDSQAEAEAPDQPGTTESESDGGK